MQPIKIDANREIKNYANFYGSAQAPTNFSRKAMDFSDAFIDFVQFISVRPHASSLSFSPNQGRGHARTETSPHKQSHPFRDSPFSLIPPLAHAERVSPSPRPSAFPLVRSSKPWRELHSRVYHCPDNNDLPTRKLLRVGFWESRRVRL